MVGVPMGGQLKIMQVAPRGEKSEKDKSRASTMMKVAATKISDCGC